ncbi:MAG: hypothetical protein ACLPJH_08785 [Myxococcaceae bacterium]
MFDDSPSSTGGPLPQPPDTPQARPQDGTGLPLGAGRASRAIVLHTFAPRRGGPAYGWSSVFSILLHVSLIALTLWLSGTVTLSRPEPVTVVFRRAPRPPPPPSAATEAVRKGSRGVALPKAVARDVQPDTELSFAAPTDPASMGSTGRWLGGVGTGEAFGPGWSNGVEGGAIRRHSLARGPMEENSGWDCGFPAGGPTHNVVVQIRVHVSAAGKPTHVSILRPGPPVFNESARECALRQRFRPALDVDGNPCEGDRELGILFFYPGGPPEAPPAPVAPAPPVVPPLEGPQPDLPVQLDEGPTSN